MSWVEESLGTEETVNILSSHSLNARALEAHLRLCHTVVHGESPLTRAEREAIAVCVSAANDCHY